MLLKWMRDDETAAIRLERALIAADAGEIVDPDGLANQLEGGVVQLASWTLKEAGPAGGAGDWESYPILTFPEAPVIETVRLDRPGLPFLGAGEATQGPPQVRSRTPSTPQSACGFATSP